MLPGLRHSPRTHRRLLCCAALPAGRVHSPDDTEFRFAAALAAAGHRSGGTDEASASMHPLCSPATRAHVSSSHYGRDE